MEYRHGSHTAYNIEYHFVWATKYRKNILRGDVAARTRELVRQTCDAFEIKILKGVVSGDHVHILVSAPPTMAPSEIMRRIIDDELSSQHPQTVERTGSGKVAGGNDRATFPLLTFPQGFSSLGCAANLKRHQ